MAENKVVKILIVDDDPNMRDTLTDVLELDGFVVKSAASGKEGLEKLKAENPTMLILDLQLPDIAGLELCQIIRKDPEFAAIPILMLTGRFIQADDKVSGLDLGADEYLVKPVNPPELVLRIKNLLRRCGVV
ncbi:MAG: response regulator transcription factor [Elusimicrobiota bacterium]